MKRLNTLFITILLTLAAAVNAHGVSCRFDNESLNYRVMYKWGLVNKQAGRATLSLRNNGQHSDLKLTARSENWADRFYRVRDTLNGRVHRESFRPVFYEKIAREGDEHKHDRVDYTYKYGKVLGNCLRRSWDNKGRQTRNESRQLEAYGTTVDMLSSFYYMRSLSYGEWKPGHVVTLNIYSGKRKELLTIKYLGTETVKVDSQKYPCYRIRFTFTSDGKTRTSDDMDAWISTDRQRIPIKLEGKLKVGKVQCYYTGSAM